MNKRTLYIFLDEGGNFEFSNKGSQYYIFTSISKERPFEAFKELNDLKYDLIEKGLEIEYFHASEDKQAVRDKVFIIINANFKDSIIDSLIVEKRKTNYTIQKEDIFYPKMLGYLLKYILKKYQLSDFTQFVIYTDRIPVNRKRKAVEKTTKKVLKDMLPSGVPYFIYHHESKSNYDLQLVDYCNWAIFRKWERKDERSYKYIEKYIRSEFDIFMNGDTYFY